MSEFHAAAPEEVHQSHGLAGRMRLAKDTHAQDPHKPRQRSMSAGQWMDEQRSNVRAYEYLCHIGEAKEWIEACIGEDIGSITQLEENLRRGVILAKLARFFQPSCVKRIFEDPKLQFRHSDNTNYFFEACAKSGFPDLFLFELTDVYDKKNIPKAIYCIHALSHYLAKKGIAPKIKNLVGQLKFTQEEIENTENSLQQAGVALPQFTNVEGALAKEMAKEETEEERLERQRREEEERKEKERLEHEAYLKQHEQDIVNVQSLSRRWLAQKEYQARLARIREQEPRFVLLQAQARGFLVRSHLQKRRQMWHENVEKLVVPFQAQVRGFLARRQRDAFQQYWNGKANVDKLIKVQALVKGKLLGRAYRSLANLDSIPVKAIQQFVHLLDDSDKDFLQERELEELKQLMVKKIRNNNQMEQLLNELDIKIALLVRNRITLDEVLKTSSKAQQKKMLSEANLGGSKDIMASHEDMFSSTNLKSLDKESRHRLELYQNLFYLLQTQPRYMSKLIMQVRQIKIRAFMDHILLPLFNYANSSREEYLLLKLFQTEMGEEMGLMMEFSDLLKGNPIFIKMAIHYTRGAKERQFLRDLLQPLVKDVISQLDLDLESDPLSIYKQSIRDEESRTGEASTRPYDVSRDDALKDGEVNKTFHSHLDKLRKQTDQFLEALQKSVSRMPYGLRFISKQLAVELRKKFPVKNQEDEERIIKAVGNLVYYRYMNPAIVAPEGFDVIEQLISPAQRKNLAEISKLLQQVSVNRQYDEAGEYGYLAPHMNAYINDASKRMMAYFREVTNVPDAEEFFQMSDLSDLAKTQKPVIYITPQEIFNVHQLVTDALDDVSPPQDTNDPMRKLMQELGQSAKQSVTVEYYGGPKKQEGDAGGEEKPGGAPLSDGPRGNEISLTLSSRFVDAYMATQMGSTVSAELTLEYKNLFLDVKRLILALIRIQGGKTLPELLDKDVSEHEQDSYAQLVAKEKEQAQSPKEGGQSQLDISQQHQQPQQSDLPATLKDLKANIKASLSRLEQVYKSIDDQLSDQKKQRELGIVPIRADNQYQDVLSSIGLDMRNKNRRRRQRITEIKTLRKTIENLDDKMKYLEEQKQSYQDYINGCMAQLTSNRKKQSGSGGGQKFVMPFSPQWNHMQELKKQGKVPQFGSFKYPADVLYKKGVLVSVDGYSPKQFDKITLTISSDETGVFNISVSIMGVPLPQSVELKLEDLLQSQFDNQQVMGLFGGAAKVNINLLIYLINKKFYQ